MNPSTICSRARVRWLTAVVGAVCSAVVFAEPPDPPKPGDPLLTLQRIFGDKEFETESFGPYEWLHDGESYTILETLEQDAADTNDTDKAEGDTHVENTNDADDESTKVTLKQLVKYDTATGSHEVLVTHEQLTPAGAEAPLEVSDYDWSVDESKLLLFANTVKVWRDNTRGDYWLLNRDTGTLRKIAAGANDSTLMFAKFSPDAEQVGYVRANNLYVEQLATGQTTALTSDGSDKVINGTFDWVYEEEFDLQDGFRWSPDGTRIAYWQLDSTGIQEYFILNNTDDTYPRLISIPYPKVGTVNSACRIGVVAATGGDTVWMQIPGDPRDNYLVNLEWVADGHSLLIEQMNRLQNQRTLWRVDAETGQAEQLFQDRDDAWVDVRERFDWFQSDTHRLMLSEQDGWQHAYLVSLADGSTRQITRGEFDVVELCGLDQDREWLYFTASPSDPIRRYLYRVSLDGTSEPQRVTPAGVTGTHSYDVAPKGQWAVHTHSTLQSPPVINLVRLPSHETMRTLEANDDVRAKVDALQRGELEFFRVTIQDEQEQSFPVDGWMIKPPDLDVTRKYPVLFYVYTEPWGQTARDMWGGDRYLWHVLLSQQGYLVATLDNRGTPAPRGRAWRKSIYRKIGIVTVRDEAAGRRQVLQRPYVDADRVAVWGWSGGGTMTLNAMFQHPSLYHVGMAVAPVGDERLYDTVYQERYMGLPDDNEEGYREGSAITHAKNLTGKLLIVHGTGDDNVHYQNAEVVINELIRHNRPFDMMSYPNRTHSIREGENTSLHLAELLTRYLTTHLPAGPR